MDKTIKVTIAIDKKTGAITQINSDLDQVGKKAQSAGKEVESFSSKFQKLAAAIGIVAALTTAFTEMVSTGFAYNNTMEQQIAGLTALTVATSSNVSAMGKHLSITEKYNLANSEAVSTLKQLEKINAETPHTLDQTVQIYKAMYVSMKNAGASTEQMINLTKKISIAAGSAGIEFGQLLSGVDGLATGTVEANSDFGRFLGGLGLTNEALKESGDVVKTLEERFAQFRGADTMAVAMSNLDNAFSKLSGTMTKSGFDTTKVLVNQLANALVGVNSRLEDYLANVNRIQDIRKLTTIDDMKRELTQLQQRLIELKSHGQSTLDSLFGTSGNAVAEIKTVEASITALQRKIEQTTKADSLVKAPDLELNKEALDAIAQYEKELYDQRVKDAEAEADLILMRYKEEQAAAEEVAKKQLDWVDQKIAATKRLAEAEKQANDAAITAMEEYYRAIGANEAADAIKYASLESRLKKAGFLTDAEIQTYIATLKSESDGGGWKDAWTETAAKTFFDGIQDALNGDFSFTKLQGAITSAIGQALSQYGPEGAAAGAGLQLLDPLLKKVGDFAGGKAYEGAWVDVLTMGMTGGLGTLIGSQLGGGGGDSPVTNAKEQIDRFAKKIEEATTGLSALEQQTTAIKMLNDEIQSISQKNGGKLSTAWSLTLASYEEQLTDMLTSGLNQFIDYASMTDTQLTAILGGHTLDEINAFKTAMSDLAYQAATGNADALRQYNDILIDAASNENALYNITQTYSGAIDELSSRIDDSASSAQAASEAFGDFSQSAADMYEQLTGQTHSTTAAFQELSVAFVDSMGGLQTVLDQVASNTLEMTSAQWEMVKTVYSLQDISSSTASASSATQTNTAQIVRNTSTTSGYDAHMQEYNDRIRAEMYIARYQDQFAGISQSDLEYAAAIGDIIRGASTKLPNYTGPNYQYEQELNALASSFGLNPDDYYAYMYTDYQSMLKKMYSDITGYDYGDSYSMGLFSWAQEFIDSLSDVSDATEDYSSSLSTAANTFGSISDTYSSWIDQRFASDTAYSEFMLRKTMAQAAGIQQIISSGGDYTQSDIDRLQTLAQQSTSYASNFLASLDPSSFEYRIEQNRLAHTFGALSRIQSANEKTINDVVAAQEATNTNQQTLIRINQQLLAAMQRMGIAIEEWAA